MTPRVAILMETSLEVSRTLLRGIIRYIREHDTWTLDLTPGGIADQRLPDNWNGNGIIARIPSRTEADRLAAHPAPKVILDPQTPFIHPSHPLSPCVRLVCDHAAVGRAAADHFLSRGFTRFAFVGPVLSSSPQMRYDATGLEEPNWSIERREAFLARLAERGFSGHVYPRPCTRRLSANWNLEMPRVIRWLQRLPKPVAVFTPHDARGRQIADACQEAGIPVPYRLALLGVNDDTTLCETSLPPLSSIPLDAEKAGYRAAELLDGQMRGRTPPRRQILYPPLPVAARASSANTQTDDPLVIGLLEEIRATRGFNLRVSELASRRHVTARTLENRCRKALGRSVGDIVRETCLENVRALVVETDKPFAEIARTCGQQSAAHLAAMFRRRYGVTMSATRRASSMA
jgi:LacI family transcriptional regulator